MNQNDQIQPKLSSKLSQISNSQEAIKINKELSRVQKRDSQQNITIDAVMKIYNQMTHPEDANEEIFIKKKQKKAINKKSSQTFGGQLKREGRSFKNLSQKVLSIIQNFVTKYRTYLNSNGNIFDPKTGNFKIQLFKYVMIGIFQLRQLLRLPKNDLSSREKNIAAQDTDVFQWARRIVEQFDIEFKKAQFQKKLGIELKKKWEILLTHCKDESNQSLRRGLASRNCNAKKVINMKQEDLMSAEKKKQRDRQLKNILLQSQIDFEKQFEQQTKNKQKFYKNQNEEQLFHQDIPHLNVQKSESIAAEQLFPNKSGVQKVCLTQKEKQKEKLMDYIELVNFESVERLKKRIVQDLSKTESFNKIYQDYVKVFEGKKTQRKNL